MSLKKMLVCSGRTFTYPSSSIRSASTRARRLMSLRVDLATRDARLLLERKRLQGPLFRQSRLLDAVLQTFFLPFMPLCLQQSEKELAVGGRVVLGIFQLLVKNRGHLFQAQILQQLLSF